MNYEDQIKDCIKYSLSKGNDQIFDNLIDLFKMSFEKPAHNISEIKSRTTKVKGDIFETFCLLYLIQKGYQVWFLKDLPEEHLKFLNLDRKDYGIDLIAIKENKWYCIQCKYRKPTKNSLGQTVHRINWKDISTFLSLVNRTGPPKKGWTKHIIMTNTDYVSWKGRKTPKDYTIAKKTFQNLKRDFWTEWIGFKSYSLIEKKEETKEDIKTLREKWLNNLQNKK